MDFSKLKITEDANRKPVDNPEFYKEVIFKGDELVGLEYEPVFDFFEGKIANAHKVLDGDFVTTEDGTGIVHIASGFGEDDFNLCKKNGIGVACPVDDGGCFDKNSKDLHEIKYKLGDKEEVLELRGKQVFETNDDIIKYLKGKDLWVKTEQYLHNYPHCWRTDTPLIYKAVSSWYVKVSDFKDRMCELNKQIHWIPEHIKDGQFGKWLENARDWSITRNRFWGAPVPVWACKSELGCVTTTNKNTENTGLSNPECLKDDFNYFKEKYGQFCLSYTHIDEVFLGKMFGAIHSNVNIQIIIDTNLYIITNFDELDKCLEEICKIAQKHLTNEYKNEIYHTYPFHFRTMQVFGSIKELETFFKDDYIADFKAGKNSGKYIKDKSNPEESFKIDDLHRPYIDELVKHVKSSFLYGNEFNSVSYPMEYDLKRVPDVLDCWFESGSMPYAQVHYPFEYRDGNGNLIRTAEENKKWFETHFPCDFVTEYVAQTRGWFYTMVVLATALFDKIPFKNVICHGVMLDANGQKLSKRLRNYPDPLEMIDIYGSDAMRWLMASSPVVQGGDMRIDKDGKMIADVVKNVLNPIWNAFVFYKQYAELDNIKIEGKIDTENVMDKYILSKLKLFVDEFEKAMDNYNTIDACHEVELFIDALNNWYIRRNKERFWKKEHDNDKQQAYEVLHLVLKTFVIAIAPILPFICEEIYKEVSKFETK